VSVSPVSSADARKYVLCRPHGGLNDTLCVVDEAWRLADATSRTLVVDGRASTFARNLAEWFEPRPGVEGVVLNPDRRLRRVLDAGTCFPEVLTGRLGEAEIVDVGHETISWLEWRMPIDAASGTHLRLDLGHARTLDHDVLLHETYGGGPGAIDALERLRLTRATTRRVERRLAPLIGRDYLGIHIRNTDLRTDYRDFFDGIADEIAGQDVLVCSDDGAVLDHARSRFPQSTVLTTSSPPASGGRPYQVDSSTSRRERRKIALDALVDVFALAHARQVLTALVVNRTNSTTGFGFLATALSERPDLVDALLRR
jgi:hypothetical protein